MASATVSWASISASGRGIPAGGWWWNIPSFLSQLGEDLPSDYPGPHHLVAVLDEGFRDFLPRLALEPFS